MVCGMSSGVQASFAAYDTFVLTGPGSGTHGHTRTPATGARTGPSQASGRVGVDLREWPERLGSHPRANLFPHGGAHFRRGAVMYAAVDARLCDLVHERLDRRP